MSKLKIPSILFHCLILWSALATGCNRATQPAQKEAYVPGLGEIMTFQQIRHAKLWFAGTSGNWDLASFELEELEEGFEDAMKYHPTHDEVPTPLTTMIPQFTNAPMEQLRTAVKAKDAAGFTAAYDTLTISCNSCHQAANMGFNVLKRPTSPPFSNQEFSPKY